MEKEPRKASDVLLELEAKIDVLMNITMTQDMNIKILSNKLNMLLDKIDLLSNASVIKNIPAPKIEVGDYNKNVIDPEDALPINIKPEGFRRTSRPETYAGDDSYLRQPKPPGQATKMKEPEIIVPQSPSNISQVMQESEKPNNIGNVIPITQRVVDRNSKSVFLANVEVIDDNTNLTVSKSRTNGAGKWSVSLPVGQYKVFIRKRGSTSTDKMEVMQNITVDGEQSPMMLPMAIIK